MLSQIVSLLELLIRYATELLIITSVQFIFFFLFLKYKTNQTFGELLRSYIQLFIHALIFTFMLLFLVVLLTKYISITSTALLLLVVSSVSILIKYLNIVQEDKIFVLDLWILLANGSVLYFLVTHEFVSVVHYIVLYAIVLYVFLYQRLKMAYH